VVFLNSSTQAYGSNKYIEETENSAGEISPTLFLFLAIF